MTPETSEEASLDDHLAVLADRYRRRVLVELLESERGTDATTVLPDGGDEAERRRHEIRARHAHLPKLEDSQFVEWDRDADEVQRGARFEEIAPLLRLLAENEESLPEDLT